MMGKRHWDGTVGFAAMCQATDISAGLKTSHGAEGFLWLMSGAQVQGGWVGDSKDVKHGAVSAFVAQFDVVRTTVWGRH